MLSLSAQHAPNKKKKLSLLIMCDSSLHIVPQLEKYPTIYEYAVGRFSDLPSRKSVKKALDQKRLLINGKVALYYDKIQQGDELTLLPVIRKAPKEYPLKLTIHYEDQYLAVVEKPPGLLVSGNQFQTLENALAGNLKPSLKEDALPWPLPVHRLDKATSGLILIAKTRKARVELGRLFEKGEIEKKYQTIVIGRTPDSGKIDFPLHEKSALTLYHKLKEVPSLRNDHLSLLEVEIKTGRQHQIRMHLSGIGYPIFGDQLYGKPGEVYKGKGLFLSSVFLGFIHPMTQLEIAIRMEMPNKFESLLIREKRRWENKYKS